MASSRTKSLKHLPEFRSRFRGGVGQPYSMLHHLRRVVAYAMRGHEKPKPFSQNDEPTADEICTTSVL